MKKPVPFTDIYIEAVTSHTLMVCVPNPELCARVEQEARSIARVFKLRDQRFQIQLEVYPVYRVADIIEFLQSLTSNSPQQRPAPQKRIHIESDQDGSWKITVADAIAYATVKDNLSALGVLTEVHHQSHNFVFFVYPVYRSEDVARYLMALSNQLLTNKE